MCRKVEGLQKRHTVGAEYLHRGMWEVGVCS